MKPDEMIEVIQAQKDGRALILRRKAQFEPEDAGPWTDAPPNVVFDFAHYEYKIKPEQKKPREWIALINEREILESGVPPGMAVITEPGKLPVGPLTFVRVREVLE